MKRDDAGFVDIMLIGMLLLSLAGYLAIRLFERRKRRPGPWIIHQSGVAKPEQ